jgi:hypothetical protein
MLAALDAFRPNASDDNWRELDALVQAVPRELASVPVLLRVFERFPRHDGHGVMWGILHALETIAGYETLLVAHVSRAPTEMGITMLHRLVNRGITHVGVHELAPLIVMLSPKAPIVDLQIPPELRDHRFTQLHAFSPPDTWDVDWSPLNAIVDELLASRDPAIVAPLLVTLDRFAKHTGFGSFWKIVNGLEAMPGFAEALVLAPPTKHGTTLLLRLLATGVTQVGEVDVAALAAARLADT